MATFTELLVSSGGAKILLGVGTFTLILGVIAFIIWKVFKAKHVYRYNFLLIDSMGNFWNKKAKLTFNKQKVRKFEIEGYTDLLDVKEPNQIINGKPFRVVTHDGMGNVVWCDKIKVDKEEYMKTALQPIERQSMADTVIEATQKHGKITNEMKFTIGFSIIVIFIMVIGMYANGKMYMGVTEEAAQGLTAMQKIADSNAASIKVIERNTKIQEVILNYISEGNYNITLGAD